MVKRKNSLVFRAGMLISIILFFQISLLIANNIYSYSITTKKTVDAQKSAMNISIEQIKNGLKYSTTTLNEISADYTKNVSDYRDENELKKYLASISMATLLESKISNNNVIECLFFSNPQNSIYLTRFNQQIYWEQKIGIDDFVKQEKEFKNDAIDEDWHVVKIGDTSYLMQVYSLNYVNIGVLVKISKFAYDIENTTIEKDIEYIFTDVSGNILATGNQVLLDKQDWLDNSVETNNDFERKFFITTLPIDDTPLKLSSIKYKKDIYYGIDAVQWMIILFGLVSILVVVISIFYLRKFIITPVRKLISATKKVEMGNLDYQINPDKSTAEFEALNHSFNSMVKEIKSLKILSYEEKIEKQRSELKYLQMQIRPHFYLNAINTISSLSLQNKNREIRKFIMALSNYLRYLFADSLALVTVKNEISHALDYIKLQQIKYPHKIFYMSEVKKNCVKYKLPKFMIQTFVENIFKHAFNGEEMLSVFVRAEEIEIDKEKFAQIIIEDNGEGFSLEYLSGQETENDNIGINNIRKTLSLTYARDDLLMLSNIEEGGACIKILIPKNSKEEGRI